MAKKKPAPTVESIRHKDKRKNIPTEELRDFVTEEEHAPGTMLYPRDPSLDQSSLKPRRQWKTNTFMLYNHEVQQFDSLT